MSDSERVCDLAEEQLLAKIFPLLPQTAATIVGPGDDAAVISAPDGRFVVSTDVLVEDRHFIRDWSTGYDVGWRAAVQNLADIAAMGARPTSLVVSLVLPRTEQVQWVLDLARGLAEACAPHGAGVVGGDLSSGDAIVVAVTVHGDLEGGEPVLRSGAQAGDVLAHTGTLGRSAAGLDVLSDGEHVAEHPDLVAAYLRPDPPIGSGVRARLAGATAMLDVSDSLLRDVGRIARASGVDLDLDAPAAASPHDIEALAAAGRALDVDPVHWVLTGGEDHGLLATFPADAVLPEEFRVVGRVLPATSTRGPQVTVEGVVPDGDEGWDHFAGHGDGPTV